MATHGNEDGANGAPVCADEILRSALLSPRAFSVSEFCRCYGIGRTHAYQEIAAGRLHAVKVGRRTLIKQDAAEGWLATLPKIEIGK
jgi:excisionase family DNA binding protein